MAIAILPLIKSREASCNSLVEGRREVPGPQSGMASRPEVGDFSRTSLRGQFGSERG
jgi:hypothetical protein